ncbi:unnamed protein product [Lampetra fluviatilis]
MVTESLRPANSAAAAFAVEDRERIPVSCLKEVSEMTVRVPDECLQRREPCIHRQIGSRATDLDSPIGTSHIAAMALIPAHSGGNYTFPWQHVQQEPAL